jgi:hypothetical protein
LLNKQTQFRDLKNIRSALDDCLDFRRTPDILFRAGILAGPRQVCENYLRFWLKNTVA